MTPDPDDFWSDRFHWCALAAGFQALADAEYVRQLAYEFYKSGAFRDRRAAESAAPEPPSR